MACHTLKINNTNNTNTNNTTDRTINNTNTSNNLYGKVLVIGAAAIDTISSLKSNNPHSGSSNPGIIRTSFGGVARNIVEKLSKYQKSNFFKTAFMTTVGNDSAGYELLRHIESLEINNNVLIVAN